MKSVKVVLSTLLLMVLTSVVGVALVQATSTLQVTLETTGNDGICDKDNGGFGTGVATASGGTAPYTFEWAMDIRQISSDTANPNTGVINGPGGTDPTMSVTVTSADGQTKTVSKSVSITCGGFGF